MQFPQLLTSQVFEKIPKGSVEAQAEFVWCASLLYQGNCDIQQKPSIANGKPDALVRFYDDLGDKYVWILVEFKRYAKQTEDALCQVLMYLGNFFYDTNIEGIDNFGGVFIASTEHFCYIKKEKLLGIMEKFEYIWRKHFRVAPSEAYKVYEIQQFVQNHSNELVDADLYTSRYRNNIRLDELIKSIYEEWNLQ